MFTCDVAISIYQRTGVKFKPFLNFSALFSLYLNTNVTVMNVRADINWIKTELDKVNDATLINALKQLLTYANKNKEDDFYNTLSKAQIASIEKGLGQIEKGKTVPHSEAKKLYKQWL